VRADRHDDGPDLVAATVTDSVCASSGIAPGELSISYLAGWSRHTPIATIQRTAALIDRLWRHRGRRRHRQLHRVR
jgi:hypothetical protein